MFIVLLSNVSLKCFTFRIKYHKTLITAFICLTSKHFDGRAVLVGSVRYVNTTAMFKFRCSYDAPLESRCDRPMQTISRYHSRYKQRLCQTSQYNQNWRDSPMKPQRNFIHQSIYIRTKMVLLLCQRSRRSNPVKTFSPKHIIPSIKPQGLLPHRFIFFSRRV